MAAIELLGLAVLQNYAAESLLTWLTTWGLVAAAGKGLSMTGMPNTELQELA